MPFFFFFFTRPPPLLNAYPRAPRSVNGCALRSCCRRSRTKCLGVFSVQYFVSVTTKQLLGFLFFSSSFLKTSRSQLILPLSFLLLPPFSPPSHTGLCRGDPHRQSRPPNNTEAKAALSLFRQTVIVLPSFFYALFSTFSVTLFFFITSLSPFLQSPLPTW